VCSREVQKSKRTYRLEHFLFDSFNNKTHSRILCLTTTTRAPRCLSHQQGASLILFISCFLIELTQQCLPLSFTITKAKRVSHILNKWTNVVNFLLHQQNLIFYVEFYIGYVQNLNKDGVLSPMLGGSLFYEERSTLVLKNKLNYLHFNSMHKEPTMLLWVQFLK